MSEGCGISIIWIILIALAVFYVPIITWVWRSPKAKELGLSLRGPVIIYKTQRGQAAMERIGSHRRLCAAMALISNVISIMLMLIMIFFMAVAVINLPNAFTGESAASVSYVGLNYTHFLIFGIIGLIIGMVLHEFAHGVQSKANNIRVESSGLMYAVVPLGAFVEMNEEDSKKASLREKMSIYSAGISINFITAIITFLVFALLMLAPLGNVDGVNDDSVGVYAVSSNTSVFGEEIPAGAVITKIDGTEVTLTKYGPDFILSSEDTYSNGEYPVTYLTKDGSEHSTDVWLGLYVNAVVEGSPADLGGLTNDVIITKIENTTTTTSTNINGIKSFREYIAGSDPGDVVTITYIKTDSAPMTTSPITLAANGDVGFIGVNVSYSGMVLLTPEYIMGTAIDPTYGQTTITGSIINSLNYPFISMSGFSPIPEHCQWWFDAPGGEIFWLMAAFMYWIFWVSLLLGITNALPAVPFDGGFLFKGWVTQLLNKLNYKDQEIRDKVANNITNAVSGFMIFLLILIVLAVIL